MKNFYKEKTILVTGGVGSIGSEIVRMLLKYDPTAIRVLDINETGLFDSEHDLKSKKFRPLVGDIRDKERLKQAVEGVNIIFHAAALKHVPLCEYNPFEAAKTNVVGTQNVIEASMEKELDKFIIISTDKAVTPINVMGATKLLAERLVISANLYKGKRDTAFSCVRFGNVIDTRGSVIPLFRKQIKNGGPLTITDPNMTRFIMSISNAVDLVLNAAEMAKGGEIFIFKMPALSIGNLAETMIEELAPKYGYDPNEIEIQINGRRPGEKLHEGLMTEDEAENAYEDEKMFVVLPRQNVGLSDHFKKVNRNKYTSNDEDVKLLTKEEIRHLVQNSDMM